MSFREGLGMRLRAAYLSMHRSFNAHFVRLGATADQFVVLTLLAEEDGIMQQELVRRACSDPNTITAMLRLLEKRGLVRRESHDRDGRARCVYLTRRGRLLQRKLDRSAKDLHARLRRSVVEEHRDLLLRSLGNIAAAMNVTEARPMKERPAARKRKAASAFSNPEMSLRTKFDFQGAVGTRGRPASGFPQFP